MADKHNYLNNYIDTVDGKTQQLATANDLDRTYKVAGQRRLLASRRQDKGDCGDRYKKNLATVGQGLFFGKYRYTLYYSAAGVSVAGVSAVADFLERRVRAVFFSAFSLSIFSL